jgi:IS30 family transposase
VSRFPALIVEERELISRCIAQGYSARDIGRLTGRHHSTISREIERNGGADAYRVVRSQDFVMRSGRDQGATQGTQARGVVPAVA